MSKKEKKLPSTLAPFEGTLGELIRFVDLDVINTGLGIKPICLSTKTHAATKTAFWKAASLDMEARGSLEQIDQDSARRIQSLSLALLHALGWSSIASAREAVSSSTINRSATLNKMNREVIRRRMQIMFASGYSTVDPMRGLFFPDGCIAETMPDVAGKKLRDCVTSLPEGLLDLYIASSGVIKKASVKPSRPEELGLKYLLSALSFIYSKSFGTVVGRNKAACRNLWVEKVITTASNRAVASFDTGYVGRDRVKRIEQHPSISFVRYVSALSPKRRNNVLATAINSWIQFSDEHRFDVEMHLLS